MTTIGQVLPEIIYLIKNDTDDRQTETGQLFERKLRKYSNGRLLCFLDVSRPQEYEKSSLPFPSIIVFLRHKSHCIFIVCHLSDYLYLSIIRFLCLPLNFMKNLPLEIWVDLIFNGCLIKNLVKRALVLFFQNVGNDIRKKTKSWWQLLTKFLFRQPILWYNIPKKFRKLLKRGFEEVLGDASSPRIFR